MIDLVIGCTKQDSHRKYCVMLGGGCCGYVIADGFTTKKAAASKRAQLRREWRQARYAGCWGALRTILDAMGWSAIPCRTHD